MVVNSVELESITVAADEFRNPKLDGFSRRRRAGWGSHITREEFEEFAPMAVTDVLRRMPDVRIKPNPNYGAGDSRRNLIESPRFAGRIVGGNECGMLYFLDGVPMGSTEDPAFDLDRLIIVEHIEAIEVYAGPSQTPPELSHPGAACGVIAFWTRIQ